ncbi:MAG: hypothetical protein M3O35_15550 [Acidobacteriota bacterium]|nr:hypothetical protein [Acidobacteriota bacterium]
MKLSFWTTALLVSMLLAAGLGAGFGFGSYFRPSQYPSPTTIPLVNPPGTAGSAAAVQDLERRYELLRIRIDDAAEAAKRIERLLTLLVTLSTLYALALGLNSYFGLKQILDSAKEDSKRAVETAKEDSKRVLDGARREFDEFRNEIREKYPQFANLHTNLYDLLARMDSVFESGRLWAEHAYSSRSPREVEAIKMAELRLAGLEIFRDFSAYHPYMMRMCHGLGRFYSSKFANERFRTDWERASLYFDMSSGLGEPTAGLWKDIGVHLAQLDVAAGTSQPGVPLLPVEPREASQVREQARRAFERSLQLNAEEPGALFGLGWISYLDSNWPEAIDCYGRVAAITIWRRGEREKYLKDAWANSARCRTLAGMNTAVQVAKAFQELRESRKVAESQDELAQWIKEITEDETLEPLFKAHPQEAASLLV